MLVTSLTSVSMVPVRIVVVSSSLDESSGELFFGFDVVVLVESRASRSKPVSTLNTRGLIVNPEDEPPGKGRPRILIPGDNSCMTRGCDLMSVPRNNNMTANTANIFE